MLSEVRTKQQGLEEVTTGLSGVCRRSTPGQGRAIGKAYNEAPDGPMIRGESRNKVIGAGRCQLLRAWLLDT